jgi:hypothetical protein
LRFFPNQNRAQKPWVCGIFASAVIRARGIASLGVVVRARVMCASWSEGIVNARSSQRGARGGRAGWMRRMASDA